MKNNYAIEKSANQLWKESGTTLSFKQWLNREKIKFSNTDGANLILNKPLNDEIMETISFTGPETETSKKNPFGTTLGVNNVIWVVAALAVGGLIIYQFAKKKK